MIAKFRIVREGPREPIGSPLGGAERLPMSKIEGPPSWLDVECRKCGAKWRAVESPRGELGTYQALIFGGVTTIVCKTPGCGN